MIIKIKSENSELLSILNKNPNSDFGLYTKKYKNGSIFGVVENPNEYTVLFIDTDKYSYVQYSDNQIDFQSLCNPQAALNCINELFGEILVDKTTYFSKNISWLNKTLLDIDNQECVIEPQINSIGSRVSTIVDKFYRSCYLCV
jgi:hypothetical protein